MKIIVDGKHLNIKFSSAHFIIEHDKCSRLHGHNFYVSVEIEGEIIEEKNFVIDFIYIKRLLREICKELDHKVLIPKDLAVDRGEYIEINAGKKYVFPKEDVFLLPVKNVTSEELSVYILEKLRKKLENYKNIKRILVTVEEEPGQGATFECSL